MTLHFSKMHGLGNDFVVIDARREPCALTPETIRAMADRHTGIGFDQLLTIGPPVAVGSVARYDIWNADGDAVGQCGNGVRCVAAWLHRGGVLDVGREARLDSPSGVVTVRVVEALTVAVDMGEPVFAPARIPFRAEAEADGYTLDVDGVAVSIGAVSIGNPHALMMADALDVAQIDRLGPALTAHPRFPEGCNAGFARVHDRARIDLRVHERGSGWTRACGTGACAAVAILRRRGLVDARVDVTLPGGTLTIDWQGSGHTLTMTGPATFVYEGVWPLKTAR